MICHHLEMRSGNALSSMKILNFLNFNHNIIEVVPGDQIDNMPTLAQIMALGRTGDKPLSEHMIV